MNQQVYKTIHSDGTVTISDKASSDAEAIVLSAPTSTFESNVPALKPLLQTTQKLSVNYKLSILSPQNDATIRSNIGELSIGASIDPRIGGFYQLHINGKAHESAAGMFTLRDMERGAYEYSVKFINNSGKLIASSEAKRVYLHQASALIN
jgi:phosphoribosylformylglycinamidine (FGAM) synthase PurS component